MARIANYNRPKNTCHTLVQVLGYLGRHKRYMLIIAPLVTVSVSASVLGTYLLKPVINGYIIPGNIPGLMKILTLMGLLYLCDALTCLAYNQVMVHVSQQVTNEIRADLSGHIQRLPLTYFDAHTHGELISRFTNSVDIISETLNNSFAVMIQSFITVTGTLTILLVLSWRLSLIVMIFLALMFLLICYNGKRSKKYFVRQQKYLGSINEFVEEMVAGQKVGEVFSHEAQDYGKFYRRGEAFRTAATKALTYSGMTVPIIMALSYVNYALSTYVGGLFALAGLTDLGTLTSYLVHVRQSSMSMNQFTQQINFLLAALSGMEHIFDMMNEEQETDKGIVTLCNVCHDDDRTLRECNEFTQEYAWKEQDDSCLIPLRGDVRLNNVISGYTRKKTIPNGISLYIKPGQKIAFVGSTSAGETIIINLVNRFYKLDSGTVACDDIDIRGIGRDDLCHSLSMVIQGTHLFTGTITGSIRYRRLDATRGDVVDTAKVANAHSFIRRLPQGYDTVLHNDDSNLSQGQRQLLATAGTAISLPPMLILGEATSSIDIRAEKLIEKDMDALMDGRMVLVIAYRLSTVRESKAILVLEKGEIIERDGHDELLEEKGGYYQLYTGQSELEQGKWDIPKGTNKWIRLKQPAAPTRVRPDPWKGSLNYDRTI